MKNIKTLSVITLISLILLSCKSSPDSHKAATSEAKEVNTANAEHLLQVNLTSSKIEWIGTKVTTHHNGTINIKSGELKVDGDQLVGGSFIIDMPSLIAMDGDENSNNKLTGHLKSDEFFDVSKFPESKFEITAVKPFSGSVVLDSELGQEEISEYKVSDPNVIVSGNLTIKDVTKNIEFPAKVSANGTGVSALAKFSIDRTQWGINYKGAPDNLVRNDIWFGISLSASN